jgi:polyhydroxyalkanoate synthesis regulator phasin
MKKIIIAVMLVSLLLVALPAVAAETDDTQTEGFSRMMNTKKARGWLSFEQAKLGFEPDSEAMEERINQAVEEGKLTQERAEELLEKLEAGEFPVGERALQRDPKVVKEHIEQAVEDGKLTQERADEILAKLEAGEFPLRERVLERDPEVIKEHIEQAIEDGKLTQERANELLERLEEGLPLRGPGFKGLGGRGPRFDVELDV